MNRAQRRGNPMHARHGSGALLAQSVRSRAVSAQDGPAFQENVVDPPKPVKPVKQANQRPRAATGRFAASGSALGVEVALPPALTRQERRAQKRLVAKLAGGWGKVTGGDGVTLVDGKEVG